MYRNQGASKSYLNKCACVFERKHFFNWVHIAHFKTEAQYDQDVIVGGEI